MLRTKAVAHLWRRRMESCWLFLGLSPCPSCRPSSAPSERSGGRLCTRFLGSQVHADGSGPGSQVHADGSGQGRKGNGLVCTRGQGPYLYTRPRASSVHAEWFCCMYTFVLTAVYFVCSMCAGCQVQVFSSLTAVYFVCSMCAGCQVQVFSSLTAVYFVCSMCAGCQVPNNAYYTLCKVCTEAVHCLAL